MSSHSTDFTARPNLHDWIPLATYSLLMLMSPVILPAGAQTAHTYSTDGREGKILYRNIMNDGISWTPVGKSVEGREIVAVEVGKGERTVLLVGGFHGTEVGGVHLMYRFAQLLHANPPQWLDAKVVIVPVLNPDGLIRGQRTNANGVDINRNFPTENWTPRAQSPRNHPGANAASEPETKLMIELLERYRPQRIVSVHAPLEVVNFDGPARALAEQMSKHTGYPVNDDIGYPTPGSFGTYAGKERGIPTITLELPRAEFGPVWEPNRDALFEVIRFDQP